MKFTSKLLVLLMPLILIACSGCHLRPNFWKPPGDKDSQRFGAVVYDPFPDSNAGPTIEGGRPLGYQRPPNDTIRTQMTTNRNAPGF